LVYLLKASTPFSDYEFAILNLSRMVILSQAKNPGLWLGVNSRTDLGKSMPCKTKMLRLTVQHTIGDQSA
jgi:hypothetical protein